MKGGVGQSSSTYLFVPQRPVVCSKPAVWRHSHKRSFWDIIFLGCSCCCTVVWSQSTDWWSVNEYRRICIAAFSAVSNSSRFCCCWLLVVVVVGCSVCGF
eukprot:TRINITY_DN9946_c0_g1_i2.p2 TRINITY_DN9946_c0_g1~~TRINITY_DN9946_c0_g1_i2.p2  ORF type:complete len:100 (+),score=5.78 TRINITY_DN9946_c0_g1_i2:257-556(+)